MNTTTPKVACPVCSGKGGFRKLKQDFLDTNWTDCAYCEGYGFVNEFVTEEECRDYLVYENYKAKIMNELSPLADVQDLYTDVLGKDLYIKAVPYKRNHWVNLVKTLLKFAHYNNNVNILPKQAFYYTNEDQHHVYWELNITTSTLKDLDGLVDIIAMYNDTLE